MDLERPFFSGLTCVAREHRHALARHRRLFQLVVLSLVAATATPLVAEKPAPPPEEPTRRELWVPTQDLQEVLKAHPNAVMLDRAQYDTLIRDAGKAGALKDQPPPVASAIESVKVSAQVNADNSRATLTYEYQVNNLARGWSEIVLPFALGGCRAAEVTPPVPTGTLLLDLQAQKPVMLHTDANAWQTRVLTQGEGRHVLKLVFTVNVTERPDEFSLEGFAPTLPSHLTDNREMWDAHAVPVVELTLPDGMQPRGAARQSGGHAWTVLSRHYTRTQVQPNPWAQAKFPPGMEPPPDMVRPTTTYGHGFYVAWTRKSGPVSVPSVSTVAQAGSFYEIAQDRIVVSSLLSWRGVEPRGSRKLRVHLPKDATLIRSNLSGRYGAAFTPTHTEDGVEFDSETAGETTGMAFVEYEVPLPPAEAGRASRVKLPAATLEGLPVVENRCVFLSGPGIRVRLLGMEELARPGTEGLAPIANSITLQKTGLGASKEELITQLGQDVTKHPRYLAAYAFDEIPPSAEIEVQRVPDRFSVDADALVDVSSHEVAITRTLVFHGEEGSTARAVVTLPEKEVFLELPAKTGADAQWKQVGRDLEITWPGGLKAGQETRLTVRTRLDVSAEASEGSATQEVSLGGTTVAGASRVSGYVALKHDDSWKITVASAAGLETRDSRVTPVRGRMAWFGLKEWTLGLSLKRSATVYDAVVTAYALPRAGQIEVEGEVALTVSGAPLRKFQVKVAPALAANFRMTSPLVGEQSLDAASGVWTYTLGRELEGSQRLRFRLSLPAEKLEAAGQKEGSRMTALLPDIALPGARRSSGRWVVEANTDTEIAFVTKGVQPLDSRRPPLVEGYTSRHRVIAAFGHGSAEHEIRLTATRHDPADLAGMVVLDMRLSSVLGRDGSSRHQAAMILRHNGRQFATVRLPEGAEILSAMVEGTVVKPVQAGKNEVRLPLSAGLQAGGVAEVRLFYETPAEAWGGRGRLGIEPPTLGPDVPVVETRWDLHVPAGFTVVPEGSGLEQQVRSRGRRLSSLLPWMSPGEAAEPEPAGMVAFDDAQASNAPLAQQEGDAQASAARERVEARLASIILPSVQFNGVPVEQALEQLRIMATRQMQAQGSGASGMNMIIKPGAGPTESAITLDLKDVPFTEALRYVTELGGMKYRISPAGVIEVVPLTELTAEMYTRSFKLPYSRYLSIVDSVTPLGRPGDQSSTDPDGLMRTLLNAQGIAFPEGASVHYDRDRQMATVRNTQPALDLVEMYFREVVDPQQEMLAEEMKSNGRDREAFVAAIEARMSKIIFPTVQFQGVTLEEAIEFLRIKMRNYDTTETDPAKRGMSMIIKPGTAPSQSRITLDLKDVPLNEALRYVTELAGMKYKVESYAVVIEPITEANSEMYTRTFKVPPDFFARMQAGEAGDPFVPKASKPASGPVDLMRATQGVAFPEGASAVYLPAQNQLVVRNTRASLDAVEALVAEAYAAYAAEAGKSLSRAKSGLVPLELEIPTGGQVITLRGHQRPLPLTVKYRSWEWEVARVSALVLLGVVAYFLLGRFRPVLATFAACLVLLCVPVGFLPAWQSACVALLVGWFLALLLHLFRGMASWWHRRTGPEAVPARREVAV